MDFHFILQLNGLGITLSIVVVAILLYEGWARYDRWQSSDNKFTWERLWFACKPLVCLLVFICVILGAYALTQVRLNIGNGSGVSQTSQTAPDFSNGVNNNGVNHGKFVAGWDVYNDSKEDVDVFLPNGSFVVTIPAGQPESFGCSRANLSLTFKGKSTGAAYEPLSYSFKPGDLKWYSYHIK